MGLVRAGKEGTDQGSMQRGPNTLSPFVTARRGQLHGFPFSRALLCVGLACIALPAAAQVLTAQFATATVSCLAPALVRE